MKDNKLISFILAFAVAFGLTGSFITADAAPAYASASVSGGAPDRAVGAENDGSEAEEGRITGTLKALDNGRYRVSVTGTAAGSHYTVMVIAGDIDSLSDSFIYENPDSLLYIDMKTASSDSLDFIINPQKHGLSSVFVTDIKGTPVYVGRIEGDPVQDTEKRECTITFDAGEGTGTMAGVKAEFGELYTLPDCGFIPPNASKMFYRWDAGVPGDVIRVYKDTTLKALWKVPGSSSPGDDDDVDTGDGSGLKAELADKSAAYVYTGSPIMPEVMVSFDGKLLTSGKDYSLSYSGNVNASGENGAHVIITGKDGFAGACTVDFTIKPKSIVKNDTEAGTPPVDIPDTVYVLKGSKTLPITATYGTMILKPGNVDYSIPAPNGGFISDTIQPVNSNGKSGNFTGTRDVNVKVVDKAELSSHEIVVKPEKETVEYNGLPQTPEKLKVYAPDGTDITDKEGEAYKIVYLADNTNAGTVKYIVTGLYPYAGTSTQSFKINPVNANVNCEVSPSAVYSASGAAPEKLSVTCAGKELVPGRDMKIKLSSNRKVGKGKYTITFIGNYKKTKKITGNFLIEPLPVTGARVVVPDVVMGKKAGTYPSKPFVQVEGRILKNSDHKVEYYDQEDKLITRSNPVDLKGKDYAEIKVSITGKGNYSGAATGTYRVWAPGEGLIGLNGSRIVTGDLKAIPKQFYNGFELRPAFICQTKTGSAWETIPAGKYHTYYIGNVNKGTAYIVIKPADNSGLIGSKTARFTVAVRKWQGGK